MTSTLIKRIALPVAMLVVVAAAVVASTGAFFSDTETSTGNTFTAGAIDLKIDNTQHYNGMVCADNTNDQQVNYVWVEESQGSSTYPELLGQACQGTWTLNNLTGEKFFNFLDVKPGDNGENTISLHIENNEAWACAAITGVTQADNSQTEPEALVDTPDGLTSGELGDVLHFFVWRDDGDNIYEQGETALTPNPVLGDNVGNGVWPIADATTNTGPILPTQTAYLGVAWCAGTMNPVAAPVNGANAITCNGSAVGNASQTDSMTANVTFSVVQSRNNLAYTCQAPQ